MSDTASNHYWDSAGDVLQGIMGTRVTSTSSHLEPQSDGLALSSDVSLGDPASFLGMQFSSDPDTLPHDHASVLTPWPSYHNLPSSPTSQRLDYLQYRYARLANNQDAWSPLHVTGMPVNSFHVGIRHLGEAPPMSGLDRRYSTGQQSTPSENDSQYTGIYLSDSGYGTRSCATRSVTTSSQAFEPVNSPSLAPHEPEREDQLPDWDLNVQRSSELVYEVAEGAETPSLVCPDIIACDYPGCPWTGKCPSDKRKHEARHRKLFKCDEPHCTRKEGFGTINDLARHRKCVHKQDPERGPKMLFMCFGHNCPRKDKKWPRLDNFRQHLTRMHHDEDIDDLLKRSHDWYETCVKPQEMTSSIAEHLSEVKYALEANPGPKLECTTGEPALGSAGIVQSEQVSRSLGNLILDSSYDAFAAQNSDRGHDPQLSISEASQSLGPFAPKATSMEPGPRNRKPSISTSRGTTRHDKMEDMVTEAAVNMINAMTKIMDSNQRRRSQQADHAGKMGDQHAGLSDRKREVLQKILSTALDHLSSHSDHVHGHATRVHDTSQNGWIQCEFCSKRTRLRCEMKKHKKRHERPYGCTFHNCNKTFGSKADWKRHENSQHYHQQSWRCTLHDTTQGGLQCARLFYRQEVYTQHLKRHHHAGDEDVRAAIYKNCIGPNGQSQLHGLSQFWCGFCRDIVPLESQGLAAWNERFNHIDIQHFKKGERIGDWLLPSGHVTKDGAREEEKKKVASDAMEDDGEPVVDDNSDDSSASDIYSSDSEGMDETVVISPDHGRRLSFPPFQDCLPDRSSTASYSLMGSTNVRKRKLPTPQSSPGFAHGRKDRSLSIEKRSKTQALSYCPDTTCDTPE